MDKKAAGGTKYVLPIAMVVLVAGMILSRMVYDFHVEMAYNYPPIVLLTLFLFYFVTSRDWELSEGATCKLLGFNRLSFAIYLVHPVFLNLCYKFLQITPLDFWIGISLPLFWLGTLVLSGAVAWLLRKLPLLCKYVL